MGHKKPVVYNEKWLMFIVTTIIVVSDDTLLFGTNINPAFETLKYVILIGILIALCINSLRTFDLSRVSYTSVGCGMMCTLVLLSGVINRDLRTGYFYKCIILILSCEVTKQMSLKDFAQKFEKIMFIVAAVSVVCTLIAEVNLSIFSIFPVFYNSANTSFYNMGIYIWNMNLEGSERLCPKY